MTNRVPASNVQIFVCLNHSQFYLTRKDNVRCKLNVIKTWLFTTVLYLTFSAVYGCAHFVVSVAGLIHFFGLSSDYKTLTHERLLSKLLHCYTCHELGSTDRWVGESTLSLRPIQQPILCTMEALIPAWKWSLPSRANVRKACSCTFKSANISLSGSSNKPNIGNFKRDVQICEAERLGYVQRNASLGNFVVVRKS